MSLILLSNVTAIATSLSTYFEAAGGTAPYVYSVIAGGAGGTINSSSGLYTSPSQTGTDEIRVTDALNNTSELSISILTPIELVCDVLQTELGLGAGGVYLYNQKLFMPTDSNMYIAVGVLTCKPFANNKTYDGSGSGLTLIQSTNFQATLSIDIYSRSTQALNRKEEIILALGSQYAQSQMELNSFYIAPITSSFINLSEVDGAAILYRFNISVNIQYFSSSSSSVPYFNQFQAPVVDTN